MGIEQHVVVNEASELWPALPELLARQGLTVQLRMIDGQLAFPDEAPLESWRELRLGTPAGMITLARQPGRVRLITWGNADQALIRARDTVAWAIAKACDGAVEANDELLTADEWQARVKLDLSIPPS